MSEKNSKTVQGSCKIEKTRLDDFIKEISSMKKIEKIGPKSIHEQERFQLDNYLIIIYKSGKIVYHVYTAFNPILNKYCQDFEEKTPEELQNKDLYEDYDIIIGQDEVGKGEMYGPMITASVAIRPDQINDFKKKGVKDSKIIQSKNKMQELSDYIESSSLAVAVSRLYPKRFNELFKEMKDEDKNLNDLLAWQHYNALQSLLESLNAKKLLLKKIVIIIDEFDKFKTDQRIKNLIKDNMTVIQSTRAEKLSVAVAAASIVAKAKRNEQVKKLEEQYGITLNNNTVRDLVSHPASNEFLKLSFIKK